MFLFPYISTWRIQRIVLNQSHLLFSEIRQNQILDSIPLPDIVDIVEVDEDTYLPLTSGKFRSKRILQVTTAQDGFNYGRIYRFRPTSDAIKTDLLSAVRNQILAAKTNAWTIDTCARGFQRNIRELYDSKTTQYFLAIFIMAVGVFFALSHIPYSALIACRFVTEFCTQYC